jgi:hypothetical protein
MPAQTDFTGSGRAFPMWWDSACRSCTFRSWPCTDSRDRSVSWLHLPSDVKRAATIAPGSVWKARISLPPLTRNPRIAMVDSSAAFRS